MKFSILNSPHQEPIRHFKADERGLTDEIVESRRESSFYIPVPQAKTRQTRLELTTAEGAFGNELQKENEFINKIFLEDKSQLIIINQKKSTTEILTKKL